MASPDQRANTAQQRMEADYNKSQQRIAVAQSVIATTLDPELKREAIRVRNYEMAVWN